MATRKTIKLHDLLKNFGNVHHENISWEQLAEELMADRYEKEIINALINVLKTKGFFNKPVVLYKGSSPETVNPMREDVTPAVDVLSGAAGVVADEYDEWLDDEDDLPAVTDGTHRVIAHMLSGVDDVYYIDYDEWNNPDRDDNKFYVETRITYPAPVEEEELDIFFTGLRSFDTSVKVWLVSDVSSVHNGPDGKVQVRVMWDSDVLNFLSLEDITKHVVERLNVLDRGNYTGIETVKEFFDED